MNPVTVAAVTFTVCAVTACALLRRQAACYEIQLKALRGRAWRETGRRQLAEARLQSLLSEPGDTALDEWEQDQFDGITERLRADAGLDILGDEGGAA